jgi:hypothetical protein
VSANDTKIVQAPVTQRVRNDLAQLAKKEDRSLANYLSRVITEHHEKVMKK